MRVNIEGVEHALALSPDRPFVLEIENPTLFSRVAESLCSGLGEEAKEPYTIWDDAGKEIRAANAFLSVPSPLMIPWDDRCLAGALFSRFENIAFEEDGCRQDFERGFAELKNLVTLVAFKMNGDYSFALEWDVPKLLKTFRFGVDVDDAGPLIDKLILLISLASDVRLDRPLLFVNLTAYLTESELESLYDQAFFSRICLLLVERGHREHILGREKKLLIDQDFVEESW
ncbi:type II-A CRISPR-associated protein Csn2 [Hugonella massiliensis]|uniref:type II-A CRISPR-associated protein Csn2 n=1 Tax=Hugonella massiliensis TaxID=1720315 RepID=UPI00073EA9E0|nr:type II-A CRISPR-associated protein Csn2 [Hugonella massiliensis]